MHSLTLMSLSFPAQAHLRFCTQGYPTVFNGWMWMVDLTDYGLNPETRAYTQDQSRRPLAPCTACAVRRLSFNLSFPPGSERPGAIWIKPAQSYCMTGIFSRPLDKPATIKNGPVRHGAMGLNNSFIGGGCGSRTLPVKSYPYTIITYLTIYLPLGTVRGRSSF